jgi:hypothetical protein
MLIILSEILTTEYALSIPFNALLGRVPVVVYAVLDRTVVLQIIGEDDRRVVRHDLITVDPDKLRARPSPLVDQLFRSREQGRENSHKNKSDGELLTPENEYLEIEGDWSEYDQMEVMEGNAKRLSG